jgi:hypothetical protein
MRKKINLFVYKVKKSNFAAMKNKAFFPHFTALLAMLIWGGSYVWSSQVFRTLHPATTILLRLIISSVFCFLASSFFAGTRK